MIVENLTELTVVGVYDRGKPNQERIVLVANDTVNLGQYGLMLGIRAADGSAIPLRDNMLWFGNGYASKGDWIFVYTGPGEPRVSDLTNTKDKLYIVHWGRGKTVLGRKEIVPILFRVDAVQVPAEPPPLARARGLDGVRA